MDAVKTILMGCGALALLSVVGCVGLSSAGYYALESAVEDAEARRAGADSRRPPRRSSDTQSSDPFSDYDGSTYEDRTYDENGDQVGGWGDDTR
ncbi:MAG: hypothetical protein ACX930_08425 [Erythrobacter sp.]